MPNGFKKWSFVKKYSKLKATLSAPERAAAVEPARVGLAWREPRRELTVVRDFEITFLPGLGSRDLIRVARATRDLPGEPDREAG